MVASYDADSVPDLLFRLGWEPDPLIWPPRQYIGGGRFDDPRDQYRVLYTAEQRITCFLESMAGLRPSIETLSILAAMAGADAEDEDNRPHLPVDWHHRRMTGTLRLSAGQRFLEMRTVPARQGLRRDLASLLHALGYTDLDAGDLFGRDRLLTMIISRWAFEQGYRGIACLSRIDPSAGCWALFEGVLFEKIEVAPLAHDDPDLFAAAKLLGLES